MAGFHFRTDSAAYYKSDRTEPVTQKQLRAVRNQLADGLMDLFARLADAFHEGRLSLAEWADAFGSAIRQGTIAGWMLGRGGQNAMMDADLMRIDRLIAEQTTFADKFIRDLANAKLSPLETRARAQLYAGTAVTAYEQAMANANGIDLPVYPADGGTDCMSNCRCAWVIETTDTTISAWWDTSGDEKVCAGCQSRANHYNPLVVPR